MTWRPPFVGRGRELELLRQALSATRTGTGRVALVEGVAGIGKTRLVREALATVDHDAQVVLLQGVELDAHRPFAPFVGAFGDRDLVPTADGHGVDGAEGDVEYRTREALVDCLRDAARRNPIVVVADDLQWFDPASLACLVRLADLVGDHPVVLLAALRPGTHTARLERVLSELQRAGAATLTLDGLPEGDVVQLAESLVEGPIGQRLAGDLAAMGGSPLLTLEVVAALRTDGALRRARDGRVELARGERVGSLAEASRAIGQSVEALGTEAVELLRIGAVIGAAFTFDDVCLLARRGAAELAQPLQATLDAGVLVESEGLLRFRHEVVREVLYGQLSEAVQRGLHRAFARVLIEAHRPAIDAAPHLMRSAAPGDGEAIRWLHDAARQVGPLAPAVALELLDHALSLVPAGSPDTGGLLADRAFALLWAGRSAEGEAACREVLVGGHDPHRAGLLHRMLLRSMLTRGRAADALPSLEAAIAATPPDDVQQAGFRAALAFAHLNLGDHDRALAAADEAIALAAGGPDAFTISEAYHAKAQVLVDAGRLVESAQMAEAAMSHLAEATLPGGTQNLTATAAVTLARLGRAEEAVRMATDGLVANRVRGAAQGVALHHSMLAEIGYLTGDWDAALANLRASEHIHGDGPAWPVPSFGTLAMIAFHRDELDLAARAVADSYAAVRDGHGPLRAYRAEFAEALLAEAHAVSRPALAMLRRVWERIEERGVGVGFAEVGPAIVRRLIAVDDVHEATRLAVAVRASANLNPGADAVEASALRCEGLLAGDVDALVAAVDAAHRAHHVLDAALAAEDAAGLAASVGRRDEAVAMFERAAEFHRALGARRGTARVGAALRALGVRSGPTGPRGLASRGWAALSPKERAVVELVAQRMSNPEIAARLYMSRRTVESHVSRSLAKLELKSRAEIVAAVAGLGGRLPASPSAG